MDLDKSTTFFQISSSLALGVVLSPLGSGIFFLIIFIILYELLYYFYLGYKKHNWNPLERIVVVLAYILGWLLGRTFSGDEILKEGVPEAVTNFMNQINNVDRF